MFLEAGHPTSDMLVGIPLGALLLWAAKVLYAVSITQKEMHATLFGTDQAPGVIPRHDERIKEISRRTRTLQTEIQSVALKAGIKSYQPTEEPGNGDS